MLIVNYTSRFPVVHKLSSMTGQHVTNQCKLIFSEYGWPETLIFDNGPCYTSEAFTSLMKDYSVNHITSSPYYPPSNGLADKFVQIIKSLFYKAKAEDKDLFKCLMIYCNTPLTNSLKSWMQILQNRSARSDLRMSNTARQQLGLQSEDLRKADKHENLPTYEYHVCQDVMFQNVTSKQWYPATITSLCQEPRSYNITTREGVNYRRTQAHLKPYQTQSKKLESEHSVSKLIEQSSDMWTLKQCNCKKSDTMNNQVQSYIRSKRDIKSPAKLDL